MKLNGNVVLVPYWLYRAKLELGIPLDELTSLRSLRQHFSSEDISMYLALNLKREQLTKDDDFNDYHSASDIRPYVSSFNLLDLMVDNNNDDSGNELSSVDITNLLANANVLADKCKDYSKVFGLLKENPLIDRDIENNNYVIKLFYIKEKVFGLTVVPDTTVNENSDLKSLEDNLEFLSRYFSYPELSKSDIFHDYCVAISRSRYQV